MSDLIDDPAPGQNAPEFTVSELSGAVKRTIEGEFGRIRVRGEVGRVFRARSGHLYYDIKDDKNVLACTTWKGQVSSLSVEPEEGLEVVVTGRMTTFGAQSKYNMNVDEVAVAGVGALMAMLEKRKTALAAEGLFDEARKKPLPYLPDVIGVITSPSGAVIRDILHRLRERFPSRVLIWPVAVQGANCAPEVTRALNGFNAMTPGGALPRPDLLIVARGGGSIEDLWGFNEEIVARAVAASGIPVISAVGHETDTTLIDYVSDKRAPTPTAAAEIAVPVRMELMAWTDGQGGRLRRALTRGLTNRGQRLRDLGRALPRADSLTSTARQRLDIADDRLGGALIRAVQMKRVHLAEDGALRPGLLTRRLTDGATRLADRALRLHPALARGVRDRRGHLEQTGRRLRPATLAREVQSQRRELTRLTARLAETAKNGQRQRRDRIAGFDRLLSTLGYEQTLRRGYAVVRGDGAVVTTQAAAAKARALEIQFHDGRIDVGPGAAQDTAPRPAAKPKKPPPGQGTLF